MLEKFTDNKIDHIGFIIYLVTVLASLLFDQYDLLPIVNFIFFVCFLVRFYRVSSGFFSFEFISSIAFFFYIVTSPFGKKVSFSYFSEEVYYSSYVTATLAIASFIFFMLIYKFKYLFYKQSKPSISLKLSSLYIAYFAVLSVGYLFLYLQYNKYGGVEASFSLVRASKVGFAMKKSSNYPYDLFFYWGTSVSMAILISVCNKKKSLKSQFFHLLHVFFLLPVLGLWLAEGERSSLMYVGIISVVMFGALVKQILLKLHHVVVLLFCFCTFSILGHYRYWLTRAVANKDFSELIKGFSHIKLGWIFPAEFSAINFSLTGSIFLDRPLLLGESYVQSLYQLVPRFLYFGVKKPLALSQSFGGEVRALTEFPQNFGVGMSPLAEAFINFDVLGVVFVISLWCLLIRFYREAMSKPGNPIVTLFVFVLAPMSWFFYRIPFSTLLNYFFRNFCIMIFVFLVVKVGEHLLEKSEKTHV
ncbi:putative membrane protein [Halobacteriovorax marinus SJ]|uniref:Membrane protein n=1 Tax=Halobacteriovorax marinus (strain ATCC BAA-682 / DSM 15412 / SJ) TaxID=862908 RepID=E1X3H8_HALMS|nr:O-antigen polymerase [Halobacteriovorax marinus]CBW25273.1 putative membrane protein [Halobacteriovorax marinus SJ]